MLLCLDIGNSHIFGGVFDGDAIQLRFRFESLQTSTSDQSGIFLRAVLRENNIDPKSIEHIAISSVVPNLNYSIGSACIKYFEKEPFFLRVGAKTGLKVSSANPTEVGSDFIATAIAAVNQFPERNIIVVDFGTATTFSAINKQKTFLGAVIQAGMKTAMQALEANTAQLPRVQINKPESTLGRHTVHAIQSGLYYGQLGALREIVANITQEIFKGEPATVIGTGGFAGLFEDAGLFSIVEPDLVLHGIRLAHELNLK